MTVADTTAKSDVIFCRRATTEVSHCIDFVSTLCGSDMMSGMFIKLIFFFDIFFNGFFLDVMVCLF